MRRPLLVTLATVVMAVTAVAAEAQVITAPAPAEPRRPWIVVGGGATSILGDCTDCENRNYLHTSGFLAIAGTSFTPRTDVGGEFFWTEARSVISDPIRGLHGSFQFRPEKTQRIFVRISAMAFEKNWIVSADPSPVLLRNVRARTRRRLGMALCQDSARRSLAFNRGPLGDLTLRDAHFENVVGNFWTAGAAIVIR